MVVSEVGNASDFISISKLLPKAKNGGKTSGKEGPASSGERAAKGHVPVAGRRKVAKLQVFEAKSRGKSSRADSGKEGPGIEIEINPAASTGVPAAAAGSAASSGVPAPADTDRDSLEFKQAAETQLREFSVAQFYTSNIESQQKGELPETKQLHTVHNAKNQLSSLIANAQQDAEVLKQKFEQKKRFKRDQKEKFGW